MAGERVLNVKVALDGAARVQSQLKGVEGAGVGAGAKMRRGWQLSAASLAKIAIVAGVVMAALRGVARFMGSAIEAAQEQERVTAELNAALETHGNFSAEASKKIQDYAAEIQRATVYGDEALVSVAALGAGLTGLGADVMPDFMKATVQVSKLLKMDLNAAAKLVSKTLTTDTNAFKRYGIEVDMTGDAVAKLDSLLSASAAGWAMAEAEAGTYEGRMKQLKNQWGDFKELVGAWVTQSPLVQSALASASKMIDALSRSLQGQNPEWEEAQAVMAAAAASVAEFFAPAVKWFVENWPLIQEAFRTVMDGIKAFWDRWGGVFTGAWRMQWESIKTIVSTVFTLIGGIIKAALQVITGDWSGAWETIKTTFGSVGETLKNHAVNWTAALRDTISAFLSGAWETWRDTWDKIANYIQEKLEVAWRRVTGVVDKIKSKFDWLKDVLVGHSVVPDMVDAIDREFERMERAMTNRTARGVAGVHREMKKLERTRAVKSAPSVTAGGGPSAVTRGLREAFGTADFGAQIAQALMGGGDLGGVIGGAVGGGITSQLLQATGGFFAKSWLAGPAAGLIGSLAGGLIDKLGGSRKPREQMQSIKVEVVNWSDIASALLNVTKSAMIRAGAGGVDRVSDMRLKQAVVAI